MASCRKKRCRRTGRGAQLDPGAGEWLGETELCGVKKIATERRQSDLTDADLGRRSVKSVADDRMMKGGEVHADLVGAARVELDLDERSGGDVREDAPVRASFASVGEGGTTGSHAHAALGVAADR